VLTYNVGRVGVFVVCLGLGWIAGLRSILLVVAALLVSGVLSWFVLRRQREAMGEAVERSVSRGQERFAARAAAEDEYVDRVLGSTESTSGDQPAS
jgi:hypothetical protein